MYLYIFLLNTTLHKNKKIDFIYFYNFYVDEGLIAAWLAMTYAWRYRPQRVYMLRLYDTVAALSFSPNDRSEAELCQDSI